MTGIISVVLADPKPVQAGAIAVFDLAPGLTYNKIDLNYSSLTLAQMESITLVMDGATVYEFGTGVQLDRDNQYDGIAAASGILRIDFERRGLMSPENRARSLLGTHFKTLGANGKEGEVRGWKTAQIRIKIASGATTPVLSGTAEQSPPRLMNTICRRLSFTHSLVAGVNWISDLPIAIPENARIDRIFMESSNVTAMEIRKNQNTIFERTKAQNEFHQTNGEGGKIPQSGLIVIDTTEDGFGGNTIDTMDAHDFRIKLTASGTEVITTWVEYIGVYA